MLDILEVDNDVKRSLDLDGFLEPFDVRLEELQVVTTVVSPGLGKGFLGDIDGDDLAGSVACQVVGAVSGATPGIEHTLARTISHRKFISLDMIRISMI